MFMLPVLREDEQLLRVIELLQDVGKELTPPALCPTQLHQQQAGVQADFGRPADAQLLKELLACLSMKCAP